MEKYISSYSQRALLLFAALIVPLCVLSRGMKVSDFEKLNGPVPPELQLKFNRAICPVVKVELPVIGCDFKGDIAAVRFNFDEYLLFIYPGSESLTIRRCGKEPLSIKFEDYGIKALCRNEMYTLRLSGWDSATENKPVNNLTKSPEESLRQMKEIIRNVKKAGAVSIGPFKNGIAPVSNGLKYAFADKNGNLVTDFIFDRYVDDEQPWMVVINNRYGVLNSQGRLTVDCVYGVIQMHNRLAAASRNIKIEKNGYIETGEYDKAKYDIIDIETGKILRENASRDVAMDLLYGGNNVEYPIKRDHNKFVGKDGKKAFQQKFDYVYPFSEGLACVRTKRDGWHIINLKGEKTASLPDGAMPYYGNNDIYSDGCFHEGLMAVETGNKVGYIDTNGQLVIPAQFTEGRKFSEGRAAVTTGSRWTKESDFRMYYIDRTGNAVLGPIADLFSCSEFKNGVAIAESDNLRQSLKQGSSNYYPQILYNKDGKVLLKGYANTFNPLIWYGQDCFRYNLMPIRKPGDENPVYVYINSVFEEVTEEFTQAYKIRDEFGAVITRQGVSGLIDGYGNTVLLE